MKAQIRKIVTFLEETRSEMGRAIDPPTRRAAAVAVIENPHAGTYVDDLSELMAIARSLPALMWPRALLTWSTCACTWPATTSIDAAPLPL